MIAEFGNEQFEVTHEPADALTAADRAVAIREITREVARNAGWRASFAPKAAPDAVGNGVHIHFSFVDEAGKPATYDPAGPAACPAGRRLLRRRPAASAGDHRHDGVERVVLLPAEAAQLELVLHLARPTATARRRCASARR